MTTHGEALLAGAPSDEELTESLAAPVPRLVGPLRAALLGAGALTALYFAAVAYTVLTGVGTWGNAMPVAWAFGITSFVWWIGIGHAGTFISAFLLLLQQKWRTSINRVAEAMTLFALVQAGLYPLLHLGRSWFFYWLVPYPATMEVWPQFMSPLTADIAAIATYFTVSLLFWYLGAIPDLAVRRDWSSGRARAVYAIFALGWTGSIRQWKHHKTAQLLLAGLATPLVVSVHSIVSLDFALGLSPGWHSTIFPPYFVAGAIFSGLAMVITIVVPLRRLAGLERVITTLHLELLGKLTLVTGLIVTFSYVCEHFVAWYGADPFERHMYLSVRPFGTYGWLYWIMLACNVLAPLALYARAVRRSPWALFCVAILVNVGMWTERFVLVVTSQRYDFLPSSAGVYRPSLTDAALFVGSLGFFALLFLLMLRLIPFVPIAELKEMRREIAREASDA